MPNIILIDNYDSFTFNLVHYLGEIGADVHVHRNDQISVADVTGAAPDAIVISPGPCTPNEAGICLDLIKTVAGRIPLLGVCLGHQSIGQVFGGKVVRAPQPVHGKMADIRHNARGLFKGLPSPFKATRYHSLVVERNSLPAELEVTAELDNGLIMGLQHREHPIFGVQFHPESIQSEHGHQMLRNFLELTEAFSPAGAA